MQRFNLLKTYIRKTAADVGTWSDNGIVNRSKWWNIQNWPGIWTYLARKKSADYRKNVGFNPFKGWGHYLKDNNKGSYIDFITPKGGSAQYKGLYGKASPARYLVEAGEDLNVKRSGKINNNVLTHAAAKQREDIVRDLKAKKISGAAIRQAKVVMDKLAKLRYEKYSKPSGMVDYDAKAYRILRTYAPILERELKQTPGMYERFKDTVVPSLIVSDIRQGY